MRRALIDAAAKLLAKDGPKALTIRRLAAEIGASTMAIYTHFGGMEELRLAIHREGFSRLEAHLDAVPKSRDPVADLSALGWAYCIYAFTNPHLYRAIFLGDGSEEQDRAIGRAPFEQTIEAVARCIDAGRFAAADPEALATQLWSAAHGMTCGALTGLLPFETLVLQLPAVTYNLYVGFGDAPERATRSLGHARRRMQPMIPER